MAEGTKFVGTFLNAEGENVTLTYNYADETAETSDVRALMAGIVANSAIFEEAPITAKSAKFVITTEQEVELSA